MVLVGTQLINYFTHIIQREGNLFPNYKCQSESIEG